MNTVDLVKKLCKDKGIAISKLERDCGFGNGYIKGLKKGTLPGDRLAKISEYFGVSVSFLLGESFTQSNPNERVRINVLRRVAAGIPINAIEEVIDVEEISKSLASTGNFFALQIKGDSMAPRILDGDNVIVRQQDDANSGDIIIALVNGHDGVCKKLKKLDNGGAMLISNNPSYEPMVFEKNEIDTIPVKIIGKVVELRGKM